MASQSNHIIFQPGFAASLEGNISPANLDKLDLKLYRDTRLLVPVDVQAMVVSKDEVTEHADIVGVDLLELGANTTEAGTHNNKETQEALKATNFVDLENRKPGVYLHWTLPDGLTAGHVDADEQAEDVPIGDLKMPVLPNRWLVLRIEHGQKRKVKGWVIEGDRGRTVDLDDWQEEPELKAGRTPLLKPDELTAVAGGNPGWAASFDTSEERFAHYDDLAGVTGSVSYLVSGWYSEVALDPLADASTLKRFTDIVDSLGWEVDKNQLDVAKKALQNRIKKTPSFLNIGARRIHSLVGSNIGVMSSADIFLGKASTSITDKALVQPYWPQQSVFHGVLYEVKLLKNRSDNRPPPSKLAIAIGQTSSESLAALISSSLPVKQRSAAERLHLSFQYQIVDIIDDADGIPRLDEEFHKRAFETQHGGYIKERVKTGDSFAHLRPPRDTGGFLGSHIGANIQHKASSVLKDATQLKGHHTYFSDNVSPAVSNTGFIAADTTRPSRSLPVQSNSPQRTRALNNSTSKSASTTSSASKAARSSVMFDFTPANKLDLGAQDLHYAKQRELNRKLTDTTNQITRPSAKIRYKDVLRALPRLFYPLDPVITLSGLNRSLRHGYDGRFDVDEKLGCRLTGNGICGFSGILEGKALLAKPFSYLNIPPEIADLLYEAVIEDPTPIAIRNIALRAKALTGLNVVEVQNRLKAEAKIKNLTQTKQANAVGMIRYSTKKGVMASPVAMSIWKQAWIPLYMEWELELQLDNTNHHQAWKLDELDFEPNKEQVENKQSRIISGRSLLNSSNAKSLSSAITQFLIDEAKLDNSNQGLIDDKSEKILGDLNEDAAFIDTLTSSLEGLRDDLLGFDTNIALTGDEDATGISTPAPSRAPELIVSGQMQFTRVRIVDSFGRVLNVPTAKLKALHKPDHLETKDKTGVLLRPRILQPSRLWFRFVDARDDTQDANVNMESDFLDKNPVAGWLLPDHIDRALEVFSADGNPQGQLRHTSQDRAVIWEGVPGQSADMGAAPAESIDNPHVAEFARTMVERDALERNSITDDTNDDRETLLNALLRVIDTTLWTVDPFGNTGTEFYSVLTGRPIAIIRARLKLEVISDVDSYTNLNEVLQQAREKAYDKLHSQFFDVRLGALSRFEDGLLGYFVDDDYTKFYPVHSAVTKEALKAGRYKGFASAIKDVSNFSKNLEKEEIKSRYVEHDPSVSIRPGQSIKLTLLMDPGASIHATCGILPRKSITLPRVFIEPALKQIAPSFRFGPVLVDPEHIRMPKPNGLPKNQVWSRRDTPNSWREDPIATATQDALLPDESAIAQEGYLRVTLDTDD